MPEWLLRQLQRSGRLAEGYALFVIEPPNARPEGPEVRLKLS
jgi:hypothetical protein